MAESSRRDVVHRQDGVPPGKGFTTWPHPYQVDHGDPSTSVNLPSVSSCWPLSFGIDRPCSHLLVSGADVRPRATPGLVPLPFVRPLRKWARADLEHVTILIGIVTCSCRSRSSMRTTGGTVAEVCPADQTFARGRGGSAAVAAVAVLRCCMPRPSGRAGHRPPARGALHVRHTRVVCWSRMARSRSRSSASCTPRLGRTSSHMMLGSRLSRTKWWAVSR